ncbi:hypothetical protein Vsou_19020 [Vulcanisaeta souniana JCM 11219]|uniref:Uncharacterized protein n=1 Tax=Vulcanisaeta souniana JCM 11219 TaxID=1293586 RepID=A0ABN6SWR1_9CREN|nr:hypothetical protein Vsou_19020 [Vulcanisaeta souniana JCM 11219]
MGRQGFNCRIVVMNRRLVILYLVIAVLFLITWVFNMSNFTGLMAFLIFLVLSFVAVKPPRVPSNEERRWSAIIGILMILFFIVCLPLSVYLAVKQSVIGSVLIRISISTLCITSRPSNYFVYKVWHVSLSYMVINYF